jgi:hypothetical protein
VVPSPTWPPTRILRFRCCSPRGLAVPRNWAARGQFACCSEFLDGVPESIGYRGVGRRLSSDRIPICLTPKTVGESCENLSYDWPGTSMLYRRDTFALRTLARTSGVKCPRCSTITLREFGQVEFACG